MIVHLRDRRGGLRQTRPVRQRHQRIGLDPVLRHDVAVELRNAQQILRARIATPRGCLHIRQRRFALAALEQQQTVRIGRLQMARLGSAAIQVCGARRVLRYAAAQPERLRQVEHRIGIAGLRRSLPLGDRGSVIAASPGIDAVLHRRERGRRQQGCAACGNGDPALTRSKHVALSPYARCACRRCACHSKRPLRKAFIPVPWVEGAHRLSTSLTQN